jgi:hypothetical protein
LPDPVSPRSEPGRRFRGTLAGDGRPGPIEERIGRRLIRLVDPQSEEGLRLLTEGRVDLVGPEGNPLGRMRLDDAYDRLLQRLERRLAEEDADVSSRRNLQEGRKRLLAWSQRLVGPRPTHRPESPDSDSA